MRLGRKAAWARADAELFLKSDRPQREGPLTPAISRTLLQQPDYYRKRKEQRKLLTLSFPNQSR